MANPSASGETREPFAAFVGDDKTAAAIVPVVEEYGWDKKRVQRGTLENAIRALGIMEPPKILMVDLADRKDPINEVSTLAEMCGNETFIIALGETNDVKFYRELMDTGINDYLLKPLTKELVSSAISRGFLAIHEGEEQRQGGATPNRMVTVLGVRGGMGASLVATNLSWIIANEYKRTTALLDLDIHFGTSALSFDLEPGRGLADALEDPTRIDELFIDRAMIKVGENFAILGSEMPFEEYFSIDPRALSHLITTLKEKVNYLVVDLPRGIAGEHSHLLDDSDDILLVTELTLAATRDTIRFLAFLGNVAPKAKVHVIVNAPHAGVSEEVPRKDFETSIERKVDWILPSDAKVVQNAVKQGKVLPEVSRDSKLVITLREIVQEITGLKTRPKKKGKWLSLGK